MGYRGGVIVLLLAAGFAPQAVAQPLPPEPPESVIPPPAVESNYSPVPEPSPRPARTPRVSLLGAPVESRRRDLPPEEPEPRRPVAVEPRAPREPEIRKPTPAELRAIELEAKSAAYVAPSPPEPEVETLERGAVIGRPITDDGEIQPISASRIDRTTRTPKEAKPAVDVVDEFFRRRSSDREEKAEKKTSHETDDPFESPRKRKAHQFGDRIRDAADNFMGPQGDWFRSDHAFDCYSSPITNPFLFEDPRALTELRPIFIYQKVPGAQPDFEGGNIIFFGSQLRLAITERWSFVMNKFGGISENPGGADFPGNTGFAEVWLGPKYTFLRNDQNGAVAAGGLQFQIPAGDASVFQDTGSLSIVPYVSYAHPFFRDSAIGTLNTMFGTGYAFSTTRARSDYYYLSAHADLNVANWNRFFPMTEFNWLIYTTDGQTYPIGTEGRDLINFGGQSSGVGQLTWAIGGRVKLTESAQVGFAYEMPIAGPKQLFDYRFTMDFVLRY